MADRAMNLGRVALVTCAIGIVLFFAGLYGLANDASLYVSGAGCVLLLVGIGALVFAARKATLSLPHLAVVAVSLLGIGLHAYVNGGATGFLLWTSVPYLFCLVASCLAPTHVPAIAAAVVVLAFDVFVHYSVATSKSSTAAIAYVYSPLWNTLVLAPIALLVASAVVRWRARAA